jgi:choloylglycine hydrolase
MNKKIFTITACAAACFNFLSLDTASACSRILWEAGGQAIMAARTWDLFMDEKPRLLYLPRGMARRGGVTDGAEAHWTSRYASLGLSAFDAGTSDGMNEAGLSVHLLYLDGSEFEAEDSRPAISNLIWAQYVLDNYPTVSDALEGLKTVRVASKKAAGHEWPIYLVLEDKSGDSGVVEFVKGRMVVHHGKEFAVTTNEPPLDEHLADLKRYKLFGGALPMPGDIDPSSRFVRAASYLKTLPKPADYREAVGYLLGVSRNVAVPFGAVNTSSTAAADTWPTRWATVSDLSHRRYFVLPTQSPNLFWVDLGNLDPNGKNVLGVDPYGEGLNGDISKRLKVFAPASVSYPPTP